MPESQPPARTGVKPATANRRTIRLGNDVVPVTEPIPVSIVFADVQTEVRAFRGNVYISMATIVIDGKNEPEARITARLRMPIAAATDLARSILVATEPVVPLDRSTAN